MKCIILAGGAGDRLWPLSRKNAPKQFMNIRGENSIFQETISRNLPFCDEFMVIANTDYRSMISGQLQMFQGLKWSLLLEGDGRGTAAAVCAAAHMMPSEEELLILPSDLLIRGRGYSQAVYSAKQMAEEGGICLFGVNPQNPGESYGYIRHTGNLVTGYIEKPSETLARQFYAQEDVFWNSGMIVCRAGVLLSSFEQYAATLNRMVEEALDSLREISDRIYEIPAENMRVLPHANVEKVLFEKSDLLSVVHLEAAWSDISDFDAYLQMTADQSSGEQIIAHSRDTAVINTDPEQLVVVNGLEDALVVNTPDAVYVTDRRRANDIKGIIRDRHDAYPAAFDESPLLYRPWGTRELIHHEPGYRVRKVIIYPGRSLTRHVHEARNENYSVVSGVLSAELADRTLQLTKGESINICSGEIHRLFNSGDEDAVAIEVDTGSEIVEEDMIYYNAVGEKVAEPADTGIQEDSNTSIAKMNFQTDADVPATDTGSGKCPLPRNQVPSILRLSPAFKDYLWGGTRLKDKYHKPSPYAKTAESWELSAHPDGESRLADGPLTGMSFKIFTDLYNGSVCGWKSRTFGRFPILIKFIDAEKPLSVQIHPDDDYAFVNEGEFGKNEVWYVMEAAPGSVMYCGLKEDSSRQRLQEMIADHTIMDALNRIEVKKGDVLFVPAGTLHAIGAGIMVCEIQQSSNSTYRVWDYNRVDQNGRKRPLHIAKAMDVVNTQSYHPDLRGFAAPVQGERSISQVLTRCKYFESVKYSIPESEDIQVDASSFKSILVLSGSCEIRCGTQVEKAGPLDSFFVCAGRKVVHVEGQCEIIVTNV